MNQISARKRSSVLGGIPIIDADTHITEWHDLWTARAPARYKNRVPRVKPVNGVPHWIIDDDKVVQPAWAISAIRRDGSKATGIDFLQVMFDDAHTGAYDLKARLAYMDEIGVHAQIGYQNLLGFGGQKGMLVDPELRLVSTQLYNDAMAEYQAASGNRIFPMALLPWWDVKLAAAEAERCHKMGMRGVNTNSDPHKHGVPAMSEDYWWPLWEVCSDLGLPVNFHIGASDEAMALVDAGMWPSQDANRQLAFTSAMLFIGNCRVIANIVLSGFLERYPKLKIVSVESGVGWVPFIMETLEYQMKENAVKYTVPPIELFHRQIYACAWFEKRNFVAEARAAGIDNVMFETDFPHPTCLYPGAFEQAEISAAEFTPEERRKVFCTNAARLYNIPVPASAT